MCNPRNMHAIRKRKRRGRNRRMRRKFIGETDVFLKRI
jgi:hypothetical protein